MGVGSRVVAEAVRRLPRPPAPTAGYLARMRREVPAPLALLLAGPAARRVLVRDITVPGPDRLLRARVYRPRDRPDALLPLVVHLHGGGFVFGNLSGSTWECVQLADRAGVEVVSLDYPLAPEFPAPVPFEQSWTALQWLVTNARLIHADADRVSLAGESAGANLAALLALAMRDRRRAESDWPALRHQVLIYPATDLTLSSPSVEEFLDAPLLGRETLEWYGLQYLPQGRTASIDYADPRVSPLHAADHSDLAPALILAAGRDPLRDDALRYTDVLEAARVPVRTVLYPDAIHGFMSLPYFEAAAEQAVEEVVATLRG